MLDNDGCKLDVGAEMWMHGSKCTALLSCKDASWSLKLHGSLWMQVLVLWRIFVWEDIGGCQWFAATKRLKTCPYLSTHWNEDLPHKSDAYICWNSLVAHSWEASWRAHKMFHDEYASQNRAGRLRNNSERRLRRWMMQDSWSCCMISPAICKVWHHSTFTFLKK